MVTAAPACSTNTALSLPSDVVWVYCYIFYSGDVVVRLQLVDADGSKVKYQTSFYWTSPNTTGTALRYGFGPVATAVIRTQCAASFSSISQTVSANCLSVTGKHQRVEDNTPFTNKVFIDFILEADRYLSIMG